MRKDINFEIATYNYETPNYDDWSFQYDYHFLYILENGNEVYIGETNDIIARTKRHHNKDDYCYQFHFLRIHIITGEYMEETPAKHYEKLLIKLMQIDNKFEVENRESGEKTFYRRKNEFELGFDKLWPKLAEINLVNHKQFQTILNKIEYKYSPYASLTEGQIETLTNIVNAIHTSNSQRNRDTSLRPILIEGNAGTGKTDIADNNMGVTLFLNNYDEKDRLTEQSYANYDYVSYTYDEDDRVTSESYNGVLTYEYLYSNDGMLGKVVDHESSEEWNYQYELMNRPTRITSGDGRDIYYEYNSKNELSRFKVSDSGSKLLETTYTYDDNGRVTGTQIPSMQGTPSQTYSYDLLGRNDGFTNYYNGTDSVEASYSYRVVDGNQTGQVQSLTYYNDNDVFAIDLDYQYDANGNITQISCGNTPLVKYYYDGLNRLIREDNTYINKTVVYAYDKEGDILSKTEYELTFEAELGEATDVISSTYSDGRWHNALTSYDGDDDFWYDENGNPTRYRGYSMVWSKGRQLTALSDTQLTMLFKYNQSGIRTSKKVNGVETEYTYAGDLLVSQKTGDEVINFAYTAGGAPYGFTYNGTPYFYLLNLQGDIVSIYDSTGEIVVDYTYDTWGKLISITGTLANTIGIKNPLRYRGYYYDTETSLYYLQSRYYDPETCRFINADAYVIAGNDYIQGTNMYAYCYNNPVIYVDPSGCANEELAAAIVTIIGCLVYINDYAEKNGKDINALSDFLSRTTKEDSTIYWVRDVLWVGVCILSETDWWNSVYADYGMISNLKSIMKLKIPQMFSNKDAASLIANITIEMIAEYFNPLNSNIELVAALGKHTFIAAGDYAISYMAISIGIGVATSVNPLLGVALGTVLLISGSNAWEELTKEL